MNDLVTITGISGFLGGHVALQLLNAGYRVRGSVRHLDKADAVRKTLENAGADISRLEFVALDLLSDTGWAEAMQGARYLQHVASPFVINQPSDPDVLIKPAVEGTTRALTAALAADVERIVLTSSMAAIMYGHGEARTAPFTAADWTNEAGDITPYVASKVKAERAAWAIMDEAGRHDDLAVINPSAILGPLLDTDPGTSGEIVVRALRGELPAAPRISLPTVDVRDVAEAHLKAMTTPEAGGQRFPLSESAPSLLSAGHAIGEAVPAFRGRMPQFELPDWLIRLAALFNAEARASTPELGRAKSIDASAAVKLLGHDLIPASQAYAATARSAVANGIVAAPK